MSVKIADSPPLAPVPSDGPRNRKQAYRDRQASDGLTQVSAWIPTGTAPDFYVIAQALRDDRELSFGPVRHVPSGRLRKL